MRKILKTIVFKLRAACLMTMVMLVGATVQAEEVTVKAYVNGSSEATTLTGEMKEGPNGAKYLVTSDANGNPRAYLIDKVDDNNVADVNGDGGVTIADVTALVNAIRGEADVLADVNGDGSVTIADVTTLVNIILGKITYEAEPLYYLTSLPIVGFDQNGDVIIGWGGNADENPDDFDPSAKPSLLW
ncbi:MAG: dockerin type I repeat-containing protein [Prevotella sp.]|nr:dockerin type I repeat-containing protein [Prevotella sp.]